MLKGLAILVLSLFIFPMQTYAQTHKAQEASSSQKPTSPTPATPIPQAGTKLTEHPEHVDADVRIVSTPEKDIYDYVALGINFALGVVGFAGIVIGIFTLRYLKRQATESANATKAMRESIELQELQFRQWVEIDDWSNVTGYLQPTVKQAMIVIQFKIGNTTKFPLTLREITTKHKGTIQTIAPNTLIPPGDGHPVDIGVELDLNQLALYWKQECAFGMVIDVIYEDVLEKKRTQHFLYFVQCGPSRCDATEASNRPYAEPVTEIGSEPTSP